jgi:hypothetical protein
VLHAPVLIVATLLLVPADLPVIVKFLVAVTATVSVTFMLSGALRRLPLLRDVF